jgi:hypothetical protein
VDTDLHANLSNALAIWTAVSIVLENIHREAEAAAGQLVELTLANCVGAMATDVEIGAAFVSEGNTFLCEICVIRAGAMLREASKVFHCWLAAAPCALVKAIVTALSIVEVSPLAALICYRRCWFCRST